MTIFEALMFASAFASLIAVIIGLVVYIVKNMKKQPDPFSQGAVRLFFVRSLIWSKPAVNREDRRGRRRRFYAKQKVLTPLKRHVKSQSLVKLPQDPFSINAYTCSKGKFVASATSSAVRFF